MLHHMQHREIFSLSDVLMRQFRNFRFLILCWVSSLSEGYIQGFSPRFFLFKAVAAFERSMHKKKKKKDFLSVCECSGLSLNGSEGDVAERETFWLL